MPTNRDKIPEGVAIVLEQYARHIAHTGGGARPRNKDIAKELNLSPQAISNALKVLRQKGLMTDGKEITPAGLSFLGSRYRVMPVSIPVAGRVQAGRSQSDTLTVYIENLQDIPWSDAPRVVVPEVQEAKKTVALIVRGVSMEEEHIYDGDYVLVELFEENETPKDGELVVTRYVSMADSIASRDDNGPLEYDSNSDLEGPTLKFYYPRSDHARLSPRRNFDQGPHVICAKEIRCIGRVVGIYRKVA